MVFGNIGKERLSLVNLYNRYNLKVHSKVTSEGKFKTAVHVMCSWSLLYAKIKVIFIITCRVSHNFGNIKYPDM